MKKDHQESFLEDRALLEKKKQKSNEMRQIIIERLEAKKIR